MTTPKEAYAAFEAHWRTCAMCKLFALCGEGTELYRTWDQMPRGSAAAPLPKAKPTTKKVAAPPLEPPVPTPSPSRQPIPPARPSTPATPQPATTAAPSGVTSALDFLKARTITKPK